MIFAIFFLSFCLFFIVGMFLLKEYLPWHPIAISVKVLSETVNLPRLPGERLSVWEERVEKAYSELSEATDAFLEAAYREGSITHDGPRSINYQLPADHPAAIRYTKAKGLMP